MVKLAYCDYIAHLISNTLLDADIHEGRLLTVGQPKFDLGVNGALASTKKEIRVMDMNKKVYKIIVEEV